MSIVGLVMNGLLGVLLLAALGMGMRLNKRLKALRDSHEGFAEAVAELNQAAARAEQGLADLRAATDEATDLLSDRIEKGRALAMKLERLVEHAAVPQRGAASAQSVADDPVAERRLGALLAAARDARPERIMPPLRAASERASVDRASADRAAAEILARHERRMPGPDLPNPSYERPLRGRRLADDDDLFDDAPITLDKVHGVRR
ncbi:MAG: flagellar positioning protein PflI [Proteobacteria bacterium]|nr:flagellar positioning protein PflI [Pseudomonadota bacterium]